MTRERCKTLMILTMAAVIAFLATPVAAADTPALMTVGELHDAHKTFSEYLSQGWDFKTGELTIGGPVVWLVKGRRVVVCNFVQVNNSAAADMKTGQCLESPQQSTN